MASSKTIIYWLRGLGLRLSFLSFRSGLGFLCLEGALLSIRSGLGFRV